jgi:hypothetical protein
MSDPTNESLNLSCVELVAEKTGELNGRVGKIERSLSSQTAALDAAVVALNASIEAVGLLRSNVLRNDLVQWKHGIAARLANIELALEKLNSTK